MQVISPVVRYFTMIHSGIKLLMMIENPSEFSYQIYFNFTYGQTTERILKHLTSLNIFENVNGAFTLRNSLLVTHASPWSSETVLLLSMASQCWYYCTRTSPVIISCMPSSHIYMGVFPLSQHFKKKIQVKYR